jgi:hypothetical protein
MVETEDKPTKPMSLSSVSMNTGELFADRLTSTNVHVNFMMNKKALKTIMIILFGFYACWTPFLAYFMCFDSDENYDDVTVYMLILIVACNSIINPLVYALRDKNILRK